MSAAVATLPTAAILEDDDAAAAAAASHYEFDADFQQKIAALTIRDTAFCQATEGLVKPPYFENAALAALVSIAVPYYERYRKAPGDKTTLATLMKNAIRDKLLPAPLAKMAIARIPEIYESDISDREFVADQVGTFARHQALAKAYMDSIELVEKRQFDDAFAMIRKANEVGVNISGGSYDYAEMAAVRTQARKDRAAGIRPPTGITTGFKALDDYLYHKGWGKRELSVLMGAAKAGKSMAMISFGVNAIANGYRVLYVTLEVSKDIIAERLDANVAERAMSELDLDPDGVQDKVDAFMERAAPFKIEEFPTGTMRVSDLRRLLERYKGQGVLFDLVIVDYADLMAPERVTDSVTENSKSVYVALRGLAMQEGFAVLTATQTNREGAKKAVATMTDIAEDFNKVRIADVIISINKTDEEVRAGEARLYFAASRNQRSGFTIRIKQDIDQARFIKSVVGEE